MEAGRQILQAYRKAEERDVRKIEKGVGSRKEGRDLEEGKRSRGEIFGT